MFLVNFGPSGQPLVRKKSNPPSGALGPQLRAKQKKKQKLQGSKNKVAETRPQKGRSVVGHVKFYTTKTKSPGWRISGNLDGPSR